MPISGLPSPMGFGGVGGPAPGSGASGPATFSSLNSKARSEMMGAGADNTVAAAKPGFSPLALSGNLANSAEKVSGQMLKQHLLNAMKNLRAG